MQSRHLVTRWRAAAVVVAALVTLSAAAQPAAADRGAWNDTVSDASPQADIVRSEMQLDGSTVQGTVYLASWTSSTPANLLVSFSLWTGADAEPDFAITKFRPSDDE